jgi:putative hydrolase of HD superfamily
MLETLIELQRLKRLDRTGWVLRGFPNATESVAAHSFGVGVAAMLMADALLAQGVAIDVEKVLRIALLHDWAEARVGDMPRTATLYFGSESRKQAETSAFHDLAEPISRKDARYTALYHEYEERNTLAVWMSSGRSPRTHDSSSKVRQNKWSTTCCNRC